MEENTQVLYNYDEILDRILSVESEKQKIEERLSESETLRKRFVETYTIEKLENLPLEEYVLGLKSSDDPENFNFCLILEYKLVELGNSKGSRADKYGVYYEREQNTYHITQKYGSTVEEAYHNFKNLIIDLIKNGEKGNLTALIDNKISPNVKGKILSLYFPQRYLNIFSYEHLSHFLKNTHLGRAEKINVDPILQREKLLDFKNNHSTMKHWDMVVFTHFLYKTYKLKETTSTDIPQFPANQTPTFRELTFDEINNKKADNHKQSDNLSNPDYIKLAIIKKRIGNAGEDIVMQFEENRTKPFKLKDKLVQKAKSDSDGYDILSFENDGTPRYIEVKSTTNPEGTIDFYLSDNELQKSKTLPNYWIYIVFEVNTENPKIWAIQNPFDSELSKFILKPISYHVTL